MIIWGSCERERHEDTGRFLCPECDSETNFSLIRTWKFLHLYFMPVAKQKLLSERIECGSCTLAFPITVLAGTANEIKSAFQANQADVRAVAENFGNVVELTESAIEEIHQRLTKAQFEEHVAVRVEPDSADHWKVNVAFDIPLADGRDWIGESHGVSIVVDRTVAPELQGCTIDYLDGEFCRN